MRGRRESIGGGEGGGNSRRQGGRGAGEVGIGEKEGIWLWPFQAYSVCIRKGFLPVWPLCWALPSSICILKQLKGSVQRRANLVGEGRSGKGRRS